MCKKGFMMQRERIQPSPPPPPAPPTLLEGPRPHCLALRRQSPQLKLHQTAGSIPSTTFDRYCMDGHIVCMSVHMYVCIKRCDARGHTPLPRPLLLLATMCEKGVTSAPTQSHSPTTLCSGYPFMHCLNNPSIQVARMVDVVEHVFG